MVVIVVIVVIVDRMVIIVVVAVLLFPLFLPLPINSTIISATATFVNLLYAIDYCNHFYCMLECQCCMHGSSGWRFKTQPGDREEASEGEEVDDPSGAPWRLNGGVQNNRSIPERRVPL